MSVDIDAVKHTIANTFEVPVEQLGSDSSSESIEKWDSIGHINLIMALEHRFSVKFTMDEIMKLRDFGAICRVLEQKTGRAG